MTRTPSVLVCLLALLARPQTAAADPLSPADSSNVFVPGDAALSAVNVQGQLTAGGDATLRAVNLGSAYVQGNLTAMAVNVSGSVLYGGSYTGLASKVGPSLQVTSPSIDFPGTARALAAASAAYGALPANGTVAAGPVGALLLTGTDPTLNVFDVPWLLPNTALTIDAPPGSTVLVNVADPSPFILSSVLNGLPGSSQVFDPTDVLFNFPEATSLFLEGDRIAGTVLAPGADVTDYGGWTRGTLIANSLSASATNFFAAPFVGNPTPSPGGGGGTGGGGTGDGGSGGSSGSSGGSSGSSGGGSGSVGGGAGPPPALPPLAVPEPPSLTVLGLGVAALLALGCFRGWIGKMTRRQPSE